MIFQLWKREFRGAQRLPWKQPWTVPVGVLVAAAMINGEPIPLVRRWDLPLGLGTLILDWPEVVLAIWVTWVVVHSIARERQPQWIEHLAVTPIKHSEIVRAKTFAPVLLSLLAMAIVRSMPVINANEAALADLGFDTRHYPYDLRSGAIVGASLIHLVLAPLFIATLASRVATRVRMPSFALILSLALMILVLFGVRCVHLIDAWLLAICGAVLLIYIVALMDSRAIAICLVVLLWLAHMRLAAVNLADQASARHYWYSSYMSRIQHVMEMTNLREVASYVIAPIVGVIVGFRGHDRLFSFLLMGVLGFFVALEFQWFIDSEGTLGALSVIPLVVFGLTLWHVRWRRWAAKRFWKLYSGRDWSAR